MFCRHEGQPGAGNTCTGRRVAFLYQNFMCFCKPEYTEEPPESLLGAGCGDPSPEPLTQQVRMGWKNCISNQCLGAAGPGNTPEHHQPPCWSYRINLWGARARSSVSARQHLRNWEGSSNSPTSCVQRPRPAHPLPPLQALHVGRPLLAHIHVNTNSTHCEGGSIALQPQEEGCGGEQSSEEGIG